MCGRFYLDVQQDELKRYFDLETATNFFQRFNIAPSQDVAAASQDKKPHRSGAVAG